MELKMSFVADFASAQLPKLIPLKNSFVVDDIEDQLRNLFIDLFNVYLAADTFDTNVLGMAHLGSIDLVKRIINQDGLVLLPKNSLNANEEISSRYIYRAWKSVNNQGRGLHFLRLYLQVLYPGRWAIDQQMQLTALTYASVNSLSNRSSHENDSDKFLTSRVNIGLSVVPGIITDASLIKTIVATILPARIVPIVAINIVDPAIVNVGILALGTGSMTLIFSATTI